MSDFDKHLRTALSEEDTKFIEEHLDEASYYKDIRRSLRGSGGNLNLIGWVAVLVISGLLIVFLVSAFQATTTREQILFATLAIMANSGQIAFKIWLNMRMHRHSITLEIRKLWFEIARSGGEPIHAAAE